MSSGAAGAALAKLDERKDGETVLPNNSVPKRRTFKAALVHLKNQIMLHPYLYLMVLPALIWFIIFCYLPMGGIVMAFQDFRPTRGFFHSKWVGLKHFRLLFENAQFWRAFNNTLIISSLKLFFGFLAPILLALLLNEIFNVRVKKILQTILYLPHFLSWAIMAGILTNLFGSDGTINQLIKLFGGKPISVMANADAFRPFLVITHVLKTMGWSSIIYIAAITGINPTYYEAAVIDGAGRFYQALYITIPCILPTVTIMFILSVGGLVNAGFDQIFVLYNPTVMPVSDIIDTLVYRAGLEEAKHSYAAAAGLFKSVIGCALVIITNSVAKAAGGESLF